MHPVPAVGDIVLPLRTWGNEGGLFGGFTDEPESFHMRRLVKKTKDEGAYVPAGWDFTDPTPYTVLVDIREMREQSRSGAGIKKRWIPNTGEYLLLENVRMSARNEAGALLDQSLIVGDDLEVFVAGAEDRGYDPAKTEAATGNIYNNSACTFEAALVNPVSGATATLGMLEPQAPADGKRTYALDAAGSALYEAVAGGNRNRYAGAAANFAKNHIYLDGSGKVVETVGDRVGYVLGIRPESAASAHSGDDLLLPLGVRRRSESSSLAFAGFGGTQRKALGTAEGYSIAMFVGRIRPGHPHPPNMSSVSRGSRMMMG